MKIRAIARVQITVQVDQESWGDDCSIGQLYKQAKEGGLHDVEQIIANSQIPAAIIGQPKVIAVITEEER